RVRPRAPASSARSAKTRGATTKRFFTHCAGRSERRRPLHMTVFYEPVPPTPSPSPLSRLGRRLLVPLLLAVACCIGLAFYADARDLAGALRAFHWPLAVPVVALTLVNLSLRYLRWHLYLRWAGTPLPAGA